MACRNFITGCLVLLLASLVGLPHVAAGELDWEKHLIDGITLSANYDVRYLGGAPRVDVKVDGRDDETAHRLVDGGDHNIESLVTFESGEAIDIHVDLRQLRHVSGVCLEGGGTATDWEISTSADGRTWLLVADKKLSALDQGTIIVGNLAVTARYLRAQATAGDECYLRHVWILGDNDPNADPVGGIYTDFMPPVAGESTELRAVIRNTSDAPFEDVLVEFRVLGDDHVPESVVGTVQLGTIAPRSSRLARITWQPELTEPHTIQVQRTATGIADARRSEQIAVVHRRLYFGSFYPLANHLVKHCNIYTTVGTDRPSFEYLAHKVRGRWALGYCFGPHPMPRGLTADQYETEWSTRISVPFRDGIAMDEWSEIFPGTSTALARVREKYGDKKIVPWVIGAPAAEAAECYRSADLVFSEIYLNMLGHERYSPHLLPLFRKVRAHGLMDKWIIALGTFCAGKSSTLDQIEREVRFIRLHAPEIAGLSFYGLKWGPIDTEIDALCDQYFIQPTVTMDHEPARTETGVATMIRNIGGMTARDVQVAVLEGGQEIDRHTIAELAPGAAADLMFDVPVSDQGVTPQILDGPGYTELNLEYPPQLFLPRTPGGSLITEDELSFRALSRGPWQAGEDTIGPRNMHTEIVGNGLEGKNFLRTVSPSSTNGMAAWPAALSVAEHPYQQLEIRFRLLKVATDADEVRILLSPQTGRYTFCYHLEIKILGSTPTAQLEHYSDGIGPQHAVPIPGGDAMELGEWYTAQVSLDFRAGTVQARLGDGHRMRFGPWTEPKSMGPSGAAQYDTARIGLNGTVDIDAISLQVSGEEE